MILLLLLLLLMMIAIIIVVVDFVRILANGVYRIVLVSSSFKAVKDFYVLLDVAATADTQMRLTLTRTWRGLWRGLDYVYAWICIRLIVIVATRTTR
jgi:hypothetical protein